MLRPQAKWGAGHGQRVHAATTAGAHARSHTGKRARGGRLRCERAVWQGAWDAREDVAEAWDDDDGQAVGSCATGDGSSIAGFPGAELGPSTLDVCSSMVDIMEPDWEDRAIEVFSSSGFVLVSGVLKLHQSSAVLHDCKLAERKIVGPKRAGNRGPGRYSFGKASNTRGMLHLESFSKHLLDSACGKLLPLLDKILGPGFCCVGCGGDFVVGGTRKDQDLHPDIQVAKEHDVHLPVPLLSVNFTIMPLTEVNGPMRIIPGAWRRDVKVPSPLPDEWLRSRLCPVPAGTAIVRDVRVLHGGTANLSADTRFLPSVEFACAAFRAAGRGTCFPPPRCLPKELYDQLKCTGIRAACTELVAEDGDEFSRPVGYLRK